MLDFSNPLNGLRRPRLLVSAVRHGLSNYSRDRVLGRRFGHSVPAPGWDLVAALTEEEAALEARRSAAAADYVAADHVELLIAVVAETLALVGLAESVPASSTDAGVNEPHLRPVT